MDEQLVKEIEKALVNISWEDVKLIGIDQDGNKIDTILDCYVDLDDLDMCIEISPPRNLDMILPNGDKIIIIDK